MNSVTMLHVPDKAAHKISIFILALTVCSICTPVSASAALRKPMFDLELSGGYRIDQFDWNIAGNIDGENPNVLSELTWEDLEISQVKAAGKFSIQHNNSRIGLGVRGYLNYGEIYGGKNQDSDYAGDNRTLEFSRSNNSSDDGDVWDLSIGVGPVFYANNRKMSVSPYVGYSYHEQNLTITNGYQTLTNTANASLLGIPANRLQPVGPFSGLNSTYDAKWYSFFVGGMVEISPNNHFSLHSSLELHAGTYDAEAD